MTYPKLLLFTTALLAFLGVPNAASTQALDPPIERAPEGSDRNLEAKLLGLVGEGAISTIRDECKRALRENNANVLAHYGLAYADAQAGDVDSALMHLQSTLALDPDYARARFLKGTILGMKGNFEQSIQELTAAASRMRHDPLVFQNRASAYGNLGLFDEALGDLTTAIALKPTAKLYRSRSQVQCALGHWTSVVEDTSAALELDPADFDSMERRAIAKLVLNRPTDARIDCESLSDNPQYRARSRRLMVGVLLSSGAIDEALTRLAALIDGDASSTDLHLLRANCHRLKGAYEAAYDDTTTALSYNPLLADAYSLRAIVRLELNDLSGAESDADTAVSLLPSGGHARNARAQVRMARGDHKSAIEDCDVALRHHPNDPLVLRVVAVAYQQLGNHEKTLEMLERLVLVDGSAPDQFVGLARCLVDNNQQTRALDVLSDAISRGVRSRSMLEMRADLFEQFGLHDKAQEDRAAATQTNALERKGVPVFTAPKGRLVMHVTPGLDN